MRCWKVKFGLRIIIGLHFFLRMGTVQLKGVGDEPGAAAYIHTKY